MILINQSSTFKYNRSFPLISEDGTLLSTSYYSITTDSTDYECTWLAKDLIQLTIPEDDEEFVIPEFEIGDNVILIINGVKQSNVIKEVSTDYKYRFKKIVSIATGTITIRKDYSVYEIGSNCPSGVYRFKNGEICFVNEVFMNMFITLSSLITRNHRVVGLLDEADMIGYNSEALMSIQGDLSYKPESWMLLDVGAFRELLILKILALIETSRYSNETTSRTEYSNFLKQVILSVKVSTPSNTSDVKTSQNGSWDWRLGS